MMGYAITRMKWRGSNAALGFLMLGMMVPIHATLIPLFLIMQKAGLLNTHWCIIIPYIAAGLPLAVFIISNFLRSIPHELEEAAFIDGCGVIKSFVHIIIPVLKPAVATVAIFTFMSNWNEFIMASTYLQTSELYTPVSYTHLDVYKRQVQEDDKERQMKESSAPQESEQESRNGSRAGKAEERQETRASGRQEERQETRASGRDVYKRQL